MIERERLVNLFVTLCRFNAPSRQEGEVVDFVKAYLQQLGWQVEEDDAARQVQGNANNLIATLPATMPNVPRIFFSAHFDTVEPNPNVQIVIEDGVIRTDGTTILGADDKAGMAPLLEVARLLVEHDLPHGQIQLLLTVCEEIGLLGAKALDFSLVESDFGFVYDSGPPVGHLISETPTHDMMRVRLIGKPAHAGVAPEQGISAIEIAAHAIARMRLGRIDEETTANIGSIHGGQATNVVCPEVVIEAEARSRTKSKVDEQIAHMTACFEQAAAERGGRAEIETYRHYEGYRLTEEFLPVRVAMEAARSIGLEPALRPTGGGSDANIFHSKGLPCVVVGTAMQQVHTHQEFAKIEDLELSTRLALAIIERVQRGV